MRFIKGITGCKKGIGISEIETNNEISVRVIDAADGSIALRIGVNPESAKLNSEEARHIAMLLTEAADRTDLLTQSPSK